MESKSDILRREAVELGLCGAWRQAWNHELSDAELLERYVRGVEFSVEHGWPGTEYLASHFEPATLTAAGILMDGEHTVSGGEIISGSRCPLPRHGGIVMHGKSRADMTFRGAERAVVTLRDDAVARVTVEGNAHVRVALHDRSRLEIAGRSKQLAHAYLFGDETQVTETGNVAVHGRKGGGS